MPYQVVVMSHGASNEAHSTEVHRGGLGRREILVVIGVDVVPKEGIILVRWPRGVAECTKMIR